MKKGIYDVGRWWQCGNDDDDGDEKEEDEASEINADNFILNPIILNNTRGGRDLSACGQK